VQNPDPAVLNQEIREAITPIVEVMRADGWQVGIFHWEDERERKVKFTVRTPSHRTLFVVGPEDSLVRKLQELRTDFPWSECSAK
jgi:hypothetical protein